MTSEEKLLLEKNKTQKLLDKNHGVRAERILSIEEIDKHLKQLQCVRDYYNRNKEEEKLRVKNWKLNNKEQAKKNSRESARNRYCKTIDEIKTLLGNKCANHNCPIPRETMDIRLLQIDHVNGGGCKEAKKFPNRASQNKFILQQIKSGSKDYQLLCVYCNWKKRIENNENKQRII
jgi:hypothetical protein